jgi:hypothetical protein
VCEIDVGRGAAHVEREDVREAGSARHVERSGDAAGGAGEHAVDRVAGCLARRHHAGVGAQDVDLGAHAQPLQRRLQRVDVARDLRAHIGVHAGGQRALVLAEPGQHRARRRDREAGVQRLHQVGDLLLVATVDVAVDEADRQRLHAGVHEVADHALDLVAVDGDERVAARVHPLDRLARVGGRGRRIGLDHDDPAGQRARRLGAREVQDLAEPPGRDQADAGALGLQHRVGGDGRAVPRSAGSIPAAVQIRRTPVRTPSAGSCGVDGVLTRHCR